MAENNGLHRWFDPEHNEWACAAYDHGPLCRLCQNISGDEIAHAMLELVRVGKAIVRADSDGKLLFSLTAAGNQAASDLLLTAEMDFPDDEATDA